MFKLVLLWLIGPVIAVFVDLTSSRTSCMTGCVGTALSLVISALTTNFEVVFVLFGILARKYHISITY